MSLRFGRRGVRHETVAHVGLDMAGTAAEAYPELAEILVSRPPPEHHTAVVDGTTCALCHLRPAEYTVGGSTVCGYCAHDRFGRTEIDPGGEESQFGDYTASLDKKIMVEASDRSEYGMAHSADVEGPPIHDLLHNDDGSESYAPPDIYSHMHYYADPSKRWDQESMGAISSARHDRYDHWDLPKRPVKPAKDNSRARALGLDAPDEEARPEESDEDHAARQNRVRERRHAGEHLVTVYRAAPKGIGTINPGDWVTPSRSYALGHAKHATDKAQDWPVYKATVKAKHVRWAGDSINEFGYSGPEVKAVIHNRGGKNAERITPPIAPEASLGDPDFRFHITASWRDVQAKAKRIMKSGGVKITGSPGPAHPYITAEVQGDHGVYECTIMRTIGGKSVAAWTCGCKWAAYSWGRSGHWKKWEGRNCSHSLALIYQAQKDEMFGGEVKQIGRKPLWDTPVQRPGDYQPPPIGPWRVGALQETAGADLPEGMTFSHKAGREALGYSDHVITASIPHPNPLFDGHRLPIGSVTYQHQPKDKTIHISGLGVLPDYKRHGVATAVMDQVYARHPGYRVIHSGFMPEGSKWFDDYRTHIPHEGILHTDSDTGKPHTGVMVCFVPPKDILEDLHVEGGEDIAEMHVTVAYLGKTDDIDEDKLHSAVEAFSAVAPPLHATVGGFGQFDTPNEGEGREHAHVALVDIPGIDRFRRMLMSFLTGVGISVTDTHGVIPHITLRYSGDNMELSDHTGGHQFEVDKVIVGYGGDWTDYPLKGEEDFTKAAAKDKLVAAGLVVKAEDTGRVLMLQRSNNDKKDPAAGKWEMPGGHIDEGEHASDAARREWSEETGCQLPKGRFAGEWTSPNGVYQGFVYLIPKEDDLDINTDPTKRQVLNPDDPDQDDIETAAWWDPKDLPEMPALRDECRSSDWKLIKSAKGGLVSHQANLGWHWGTYNEELDAITVAEEHQQQQHPNDVEIEQSPYKGPAFMGPVISSIDPFQAPDWWNPEWGLLRQQMDERAKEDLQTPHHLPFPWEQDIEPWPREAARDADAGWDMAESHFPNRDKLRLNQTSWITPKGKILEMPHEHSDIGQDLGYEFDDQEEVNDRATVESALHLGGVRVGTYNGQLSVEHHESLTGLQHHHLMEYHRNFRPTNVWIERGGSPAIGLHRPNNQAVDHALRGHWQPKAEAKHVLSGYDPFLLEADLHDEPEPALPATDGTGEPAAEETPSDNWVRNHGPEAPNPGSAGPPDFGQPLDPNEYRENMGLRETDDKLLEPGSVNTDEDESKTEREFAALDSQASLRPAWLEPGGSGSTPIARQRAENRQIAQMAQRFLKEGMRAFSAEEQADLIGEGEAEGTRAGNLASLDLTNTHYQAIEDSLQAAEAMDDAAVSMWD